MLLETSKPQCFVASRARIVFRALRESPPVSLAAIPAGSREGREGSLRQFHDLNQRSVVAAEAIPEELDAFRPTSEVRRMGQLIGHIADTLYSRANWDLRYESSSAAAMRTKPLDPGRRVGASRCTGVGELLTPPSPGFGGQARRRRLH